jgi:hypothetical protein
VGAAGAGPLSVGEYRAPAAGRLERSCPGNYQSAAADPAAARAGPGGRFRQRFEFFSADSVGYSLEWFHDGAWRPFGVQFAKNTLLRIRP